MTDQASDNATAPEGAANGAEGASQASSAEPSLEERLTALTAERDEAKDRMLRLAAEFENWKKRARKDQLEGESKARENVLRDLLEVMDNLDRAVSSAEAGGPAADPAAILKGVQLVLRLFQTKLERYDVRPVEAKGLPFDPRIHEAVSQVPSQEVPVGHVVNELQRGYKIGDRLLRPALVAVATASTG